MGGSESQDAKLKQELEQLRAGIVAVSQNWATLENTTANLLEQLLSHSPNNVGLAIYFAPVNAETRFDIVDRALKAVLFRQQSEKEILAEWNYVMKKLDKARRNRNMVAHGMIMPLSWKDKSYARLTGPIFEMSRAGQPVSRQLPGMSPHDVLAIARNIDAVQKSISLFARIVRALHSGDVPTLQKTLLALATRRQSASGPRSGDQTPL